MGVAAGVMQALRLGTLTDTALTLVTTAVYAAPSFWLSLTLIALFTYGAATLGLPSWAILPAVGMQDPAGDFTGAQRLLDMARHAILPISARDYPLILGIALIYGTVVIFANLAADLVLPVVDRRRRAV
jgi:ABC-type dipeptide/oligopeptide/nickel transport system permease component